MQGLLETDQTHLKNSIYLHCIYYLFQWEAGCRSQHYGFKVTQPVTPKPHIRVLVQVPVAPPIQLSAKMP